MNCVQCGVTSKYKCPTCRQPYCSATCCKKHKLTPCFAPPSPSYLQSAEESPRSYEFPTEDTVPLERLKLLEQSPELKKCLENPHVRDILKLLDNSPHPDNLMEEYMQEPIFTELVDACLKVVQSQDEQNKVV